MENPITKLVRLINEFVDSDPSISLQTYKDGCNEVAILMIRFCSSDQNDKERIKTITEFFNFGDDLEAEKRIKVFAEGLLRDPLHMIIKYDALMMPVIMYFEQLYIKIGLPGVSIYEHACHMNACLYDIVNVYMLLFSMNSMHGGTDWGKVLADIKKKHFNNTGLFKDTKLMSAVAENIAEIDNIWNEISYLIIEMCVACRVTHNLTNSLF